MTRRKYMKLWRRKNRKRLAFLQRKWYKNNLEKARRLARKYYRCKKNTYKFRRATKIYRDKNRHNLATKSRTYQARRAPRLKMEVFNHYCNGDIKCQCSGCPIRHLALLTVDHVRGGGNNHKSVSGNRITGYRLWAWLKRNNFPVGFQILCGACNLAKGTKKYCPRYGKEH